MAGKFGAKCDGDLNGPMPSGNGDEKVKKHALLALNTAEGG